MANVGDVTVQLRASIDKFRSDLAAGEQALRRFVTDTRTLFAGGLATVGISLGIKEIIDAASEAESQIIKLDQALRATGQYTPQYSQALRELAQSFQRTTAFSDELVLSVERQLIQYGASGAEIKRYTQIVLDLAASGRGVEGSVDAVGKAISGRFTPLARLLGIELDETSTRAQKQSRVFEELARRVGGQAAAELETFGGQARRLGNIIGDLEEELGGIIVQSPTVRSALERFTGTTIRATESVHGWVAENRALIEQRIGETIEGVASHAGEAAEAFRSLASGIESALRIWNTLPVELKGAIIGGVAGGAVGVPQAGAGIGAVGGFLSRIGNLNPFAASGRNEPALPMPVVPPQVTNVVTGGNLATRLAAGGQGFRQPASPVDVKRSLDEAARTAESLAALQQQAYDVAKARGADAVELENRLNGLEAASLDAIKAKAAAEQGKTDQQALQAQIGAQQLKFDQERLDILRQQEATQQAFAAADIAYAQNAVDLADQQFQIAQQQGATRAELLEIAQRQDDAERRKLEAQRAALEITFNQKEAEQATLGVSQQRAAELEQLNAQIEGINDKLALGPQHVRALHQEFINLGDTLDSITATFTTGILLGTNKNFADFGRQAGEALISELIRSTLKEKGVFDFKIRSNLLELVGFAGESGQQAGQGFVGGLINKVGSLIGSGSRTTTTGAATAQGGTATATTAAAGSAAAGGASAATLGYVAAALAAIQGGISASEAVNHLYTNQTALGFRPVTNAAQFQAAQQGFFSGIFGGGVGNTLASALLTRPGQPSYAGTILGNALTLGIPQALGIKGQNYAAGYVLDPVSAIIQTFGLAKPPTLEDQFGKAMDKLFTQYGIQRATVFQGTVYDRPLSELIARSAKAPEVQRVIQGTTGPEALRGPLSSIGLLLEQGNPVLANYFANTFVNNARALNLTAAEATAQFQKLAQAIGLDLVSGLERANDLYSAGALTLDGYKGAVTAVIRELSTLPPALDAAAVAADAIDKATGKIDPQRVTSLVTSVAEFASKGLQTILQTQIGAGGQASAADVGAALGKQIGDSLVTAAEAEILQKDLLGKFLTKGATELSDAVTAYVAGNVASATALRDQALKDFAQGAADASKFLGPFGTFISQTQNLLLGGGSAVAAFTGRGGFSLPSFDTGGIMPGPIGQPNLAVLHGGEVVSPYGDVVDAITGLRTDMSRMVRAFGRGGDVRVDAVLTLDGREVDRVQLYNMRNRRTGMVLPDTTIGTSR